MDINLSIYNENRIYDIAALCEGEITLTSARKGEPSKLTFKVARDISSGGKINFAEGNAVELTVNGEGIFRGYIFSKSRSKEQIITVTAYDQTRYLKNKQFYKYENKKASQLIKMIADDFMLKTGTIADTGYVIARRREDGQSLFDIILTALELTLINTKKLYVFYDDFGKLTLKHIDDMMLPFMIVSDDTSIIDFEYKTDIDSDTYNRIKLYRDNNEKGVREVYVSEDSLNQKKWGILQYYEEISEYYNEAQIKDIADKLLNMKNRIKKTLSVECLCTGIGEEKIRGGSSLIVKIDDLGETSINSLLIVEKCTHTFKNNEHRIKIELTGV